MSSLLIFSCSYTKRTGTQPDLEEAIKNFIAGHAEIARQQLEPLTGELEGEELSLAYLYLGRCYLGLGDFERASEAFMLGKIHDQEGPFDEYLSQIRYYFGATPQQLIKADSITRAQLACLVMNYYRESSSRIEQDIREPVDITSHWARDPILQAMKNQYMSELPDSRFHPEVKVTCEAFLYFISRLARRFSHAELLDLDASFPDGVHDKLKSITGISIEISDRAYITGNEAVNALEQLSRWAAN